MYANHPARGAGLCVGVLCLTVGVLAAAAGAGERVPNGGFEVSGTEIVGWRVFNLAGDTFSVALSSEAHSGERALRIARTAGGGDAGVDLWDRQVRVSALEDLHLRFAARKEGGDDRSRLHVSVHEFGVAGSFLAEGDHARSFDPGSDGYSELEWRLRLVSPLTAWVSIGFRLGDVDGGLSHPGAYLIDDVSLSPQAGLSTPGVSPSNAGTDSGGFSVRDYGAEGDGTTDDTAAFQQALNERHLAGGGTVHIPPGRYLIAGHLLVPRAVTLRGVWHAPPIPVRYRPQTPMPAEPMPLAGSVLLAVEGAGDAAGVPFIRLDANACVRGLSIVYPDQTRTNPPVAYPWTVATIGADNCSIIDVLMLNPYQAVDFGSHASGRHYVRGLYADPLRRGLYIDQCLDVGRVSDVHFWPFYDPDLNGPLREYVLANCEAFVVGRTDWEYFTNCFAYGQHIGFHFIRGRGTGAHAGPGNVLMTQSGADMADTAILVDELQGHSGLLASNSQFFGDVVVDERNVGPMRFSNCGFYGSIHGRRGVGQALLAGNGSVSFQNCHFIALHPENRAPASILARNGALSLVGCEFSTAGRSHIVLEPGLRRAVITGNQFAGRAGIVDRSGARVEIVGNVDDLPAMPEGAILVEDGDAGGGFSTSGPWHRATGPGNFMNTCHWAEPANADTEAEWRPEIPVAGQYGVEVWYGPDPNDDHATNARFTVRYAAGRQTFTVNLKQSSGRWNRLGVFRFEAGRSGAVGLSAEADANVVADAVRFVPVE